MATWVLKLRSRRQAATIPEAANDKRDKKGWFFMTWSLLPLVVAMVFGLAPCVTIAAESGPKAPMKTVSAVLPAAPAVKSRFHRVMVVVLENASSEEAAKQPFLASLGRRGAILSNVTAEAHPSQPNYLALLAGSTFGVRSDRNVNLEGSQLGDLLEAKGLQWKVYAEGFPGHCFLGPKQGDYVRKHVPMLSFKNVQSDPARCGRVVEAAQLSQDLQSGSLPDFSLYIPNLKNDGHDTSVAFADKWLARKFGPLLADPGFTRDLLFVVTFDEDEHFLLLPSSNHVLTVAVGDGVLPGSQSNAPYTHYSILRLVEDGLGCGTLGREDANAAAITGIWR
jgi:acid phosphatase